MRKCIDAILEGLNSERCNNISYVSEDVVIKNLKVEDGFPLEEMVSNSANTIIKKYFEALGYRAEQSFGFVLVLRKDSDNGMNRVVLEYKSGYIVLTVEDTFKGGKPTKIKLRTLRETAEKVKSYLYKSTRKVTDVAVNVDEGRFYEDGEEFIQWLKKKLSLWDFTGATFIEDEYGLKLMENLQVRFNPESRTASITLSDEEIEIGNKAKNIKEFEKAIDIAKSDLSLMVKEANNDLDKIKKLVREYVDSHPDFKWKV